MTSFVDLDIENYKLNDILNLFKVPMDFDEDDLKMAKKKTLMMHPDKSKLSKEYFLFYSKAYKKLYHIYKFRNSSSNSDFDIEYEDVVKEYEEARDVKNSKDTKDFNKWFNKTFEELKDNDTDGYSDWLKEESNELYDKLKESKNEREKQEIIEERKKHSRELTLYKETEELNASFSYGASNLSKSKPDNYSNNEIFSKNPYEDVKYAYENSLVGVTQDDYTEKEKFKNVFELQGHRKENEVVMNDSLKKQQERFLERKKKIESESATNVGWELANEIEESQRKNDKFMSKFSLLKYN